MKRVVIVLILFFVFPFIVTAKQGCCSHHGGVAGCSKNGRQVCKDGSLSPTCTCTPVSVYGCTDPKANNYNWEATVDNGSCTYTIYGCMDKNALNFNSQANTENNSCTYQKEITLTEEIPFSTQKVDDNSLIKGEEIIEQEGKNGLKEVKYKIIVDKNDVELSRTFLDEKIVFESEPQIVRIGMKESTETSSFFLGLITILLLSFGFIYRKKIFHK